MERKEDTPKFSGYLIMPNGFLAKEKVIGSLNNVLKERLNKGSKGSPIFPRNY